MDKVFKSQNNIDLLYEIISTSIFDEFNYDIEDKYDEILQKAIEYVWMNVDHIPPKSITVEKYLDMMNIKVISLVIPVIKKDLHQPKNQISQPPKQQIREEPPKPLQPIPPPRITTQSAKDNSSIDETNQKYNDLIKLRDTDLPHPVQKPLQTLSPPEIPQQQIVQKIIREDPHPTSQIMPQSVVQKTARDEPIQQPKIDTFVNTPSAPLMQSVVPKIAREEPVKEKKILILSTKQRDFLNSKDINNFSISINKKGETQNNKLIRGNANVIYNIPAMKSNIHSVEIKDQNLFIQKISIPFTKKLLNNPYILFNINDVEIPFISDIQNSNYIYYKPVIKRNINISNKDNIAIKIYDNDKTLINIDTDKYVVKGIEKMDKGVKIKTEHKSGIEVGDKMYFYDTRPHDPIFITFNSVDGKTQYNMFKMEVNDITYKFSVIGFDKITNLGHINFKTFMNNDDDNYLYIVSNKNGMSKTEYFQIKDITPDYLVLGTFPQPDIEIIKIGYAIRDKMGYQNNLRLFNEKGCIVSEIQDDGIVVDIVMDDTLNNVKENDIFYVSSKNQIIIIGETY